MNRMSAASRAKALDMLTGVLREIIHATNEAERSWDDDSREARSRAEALMAEYERHMPKAGG